MHLPARWLLPALVALSVTVACGGSDDDDGLRLVVVDQNILHGMLDEDPLAQPWDRFPERLPLLASALADLRPEAVFLQEVNVTAADDYVDVRAALADTMGDEYTQVFGDITGAAIGEGALGQMTLTRLPVVSSENRHIGGVRAVHRVTVQTDEGAIDMYNAHLEGTDDDDPQVALDEIAKVMTFIEETRTPGAAVILAGDFNAKPDDLSVRALLEERFIDALAVAGDATCAQVGDVGCTNSTKPLGDNPEHLSDQRIDFIFVQSGQDVEVTVEEAELFFDDPLDIGDGRLLWVSDHVGVKAVLKLEAR